MFGNPAGQKTGGGLLGTSVFGGPAVGQTPATQQPQLNQPQRSTLFGVNQQQQQSGLVPWQQALNNSSLWQPNSGVSPRQSYHTLWSFHTNTLKMRRAFQIKLKQSSTSGIPVARIALSKPISTTTSRTMPKNCFDQARVRIQRNGRQR